MDLCKFSKSSILRSSILASCPLSLTAKQAKSCECKRREYNVPPCDLRVVVCTFPKRWDGGNLRNDRSSDSVESWINQGVKKMSATAMVEKTVEKPEKTEAAGETVKTGIWGGIKIPIIGITGEKFSGKTLFLASIDPAHTCMVDLEDSSESYNIEFAERISLYDEMLRKHNRAATAVECYEWFMKFIEDIPAGKFTVLAVDPYSDIQAGMVDWVKANPGKFGHTAAQYERASGLLWADVKQHCKMMLGILSRKVETFVFSTHMGSVWKGGAPTDKRKAKGLDTLFELSSLYLELERKPDDKGKVDKKPSGKVLKSRLAISKTVDGEIEHFPILPPRMPVATPAAIREYIKNPPDYLKLKKGELVEKEVLSEDEKLEIQREIATTQLEVETARLSQMEMVKASAEKQADLKRRQAAAAAAASAPGQVKTEAVEAKVAETNGKPAATTTAASTTTEPVSQSVKDRVTSVLGKESEPIKPIDPDGPTVYEILESQKKQLGITNDQWLAILKKRNVSETSSLSVDQAEEIRRALWNKLTQKGLAADVASGNASKN